MSDVEHQHSGMGSLVEIVLDSSGLVLSVSASQESQRIVADVAEGESLHAHIHPDDYDFFLWSAQWIMNGAHRQQTIQLRWARAGGRFARVNVTLRSESDETIVLVLAPDEVEHARRAEAQLRRVVEGSAQGICVRTNTEVIYVNEAFAHMTGYASVREMNKRTEEETAAGRNQNNLGGIHPDDRHLVIEHMRRRLAGEESVSNYEFRLLRADGEPLWVETRAALVNWDGKPASLSWMSDISHRKAMEEELIKSKEAAELANRTKTEFLANMSHELRTPLNAIIGFAEVIKDQMFGPVGTPKYAEYAKDIHTSGRHLLELINDILDLSKIEAGKLELREEDIEPGRTAEDCLTLIRNRAEKSDVHLALEVGPGLPLLRCDVRAIRQVLLNFLSNAVKFTPAGGTVTTKVERTADGIAFSVIDTGIGMSAADVKVALQAFGQIDSKVARQHQGTGLGLPISKSLIEMHGGTLTVVSAPGEGTTMTATFPVERIVTLAA
ncbi:MAG: PAS domain S-box protein [Alphaproteobacteria bacterium]|nr:PAS domain S-box protein [Alphaproteobacteria bacterium]